MKINFNGFIKKIGYAFSANIISMIISMIMTIVLPKMISVTNYGYWQLYLFYISYICFFHFGLSDGLYLKYGGTDYKSLDKPLINSQFILLNIMQIILAITMFFFVISFVTAEKKIILILSIINLFLIIPKNFIMLVLQATNEIEKYAKITIIEKILYCIFLLISVFINSNSFVILIFAEMLAKFIVLVMSLATIWDIVTIKPISIQNGLIEAKENIGAGIKLMLANTASMLILGVIKMGIERTWSIETFGKVSLAITMSNMIISAISSLGVVMFPLLRNTDNYKLPELYKHMRMLLMIILITALIIYYPAKVILDMWLPQYIESIKFIGILFPICIFEGKVSIIINTYLKTLRKEKYMLLVNIFVIGISLILTVTLIALHASIIWFIIGIVFLFALRCTILEYILSQFLNINVKFNILLDLLISVIFIILNINFSMTISLIVYIMCYLLYLFVSKKEMMTTYHYFKTHIH